MPCQRTEATCFEAIIVALGEFDFSQCQGAWYSIESLPCCHLVLQPVVMCSHQNLEAVSMGQMVQVAAVALGAWLVAHNASPLQRLWVAPPLVFGLGFIDSSIQGLCTESWVRFLCDQSSVAALLCNIVDGACYVAMGVALPLTMPAIYFYILLSNC